MSASAIRPRRGFREDAMYCGRCVVTWPAGYPVGGGSACPMPRPTPSTGVGAELLRKLRGDLDGRCGAVLVPAEVAYEHEQEQLRTRRD